jgi:glycosyltransferase involved in cell wall biosynthesis
MPFGSSVTNSTMVLVYDRMNTGGIETMMLRMVDWLVARSMPVVVCCLPGGELQTSISAKAHIINYETSAELMQKMRLWCEQARAKTVLLMSFDSAPAARALMLESALSDLATVSNVAGVFHPKAYFMPGQPPDRLWLNRRILSAYGSEHVFFMNRESLVLHEDFMGLRFDKAAIIPIPVEVDAPSWVQQAGQDTLRVVSVGRLVDFKAYNLGAGRTVRECLNNGVSVSWDIYGYGPQHDLIEKSIAEQGMQSRVFLKGMVQYHELFKVMGQYDVFVGMGTAAVEAAAMGMPSLVAQVESQDRSHGYLDELPFGNIGEVIEGMPARLLSEILCEQARRTPQERQQCADRCLAAARRYSIDDFMRQVILVAEKPVTASLRIRKKWVAQLAHALLDGWIARHVLGKGLMSKIKRALGAS